jgi:hypothetical protein
LVQQPLLCQGLLIVEAARSHSRHTTLGRTPLDGGSACRRDLYLIKHNNHKTQTPMPAAGFEPAILANQRPPIHSPNKTSHCQILNRTLFKIPLSKTMTIDVAMVTGIKTDTQHGLPPHTKTEGSRFKTGLRSRIFGCKSNRR